MTALALVLAFVACIISIRARQSLTVAMYERAMLRRRIEVLEDSAAMQAEMSYNSALADIAAQDGCVVIQGEDGHIVAVPGVGQC